MSDSGQLSQIYRAELRQIFRPGRNMTVDYQSEISFSILQGTLSWQPTVVGLIYITDFRHASG